MNASKGSANKDVESWQSPSGSLVITHPAPAVILFTYEGHATVDAVSLIEQSVDRVLATGVRPDLFIDLDRITGYDADYRKAVSAWGAKFYPQFGEVRVLVRSRIVAMGIAVSNLTAAGRLRPTTRRPEFQAALEAAIARYSVR